MCGLKRGYKVNNLKNWLAVNIYDINNNKEVKVVIILKSKLKSARGFLVYLAVITVFYKMLNRLNFNFITCSLKNSKQLVNR
jgi:hypothetical protein